MQLIGPPKKVKRPPNETSKLFDAAIDDENRFKVIMRVSILEKYHEVTGFKRFYFHVAFLNHSKWNQNNYNNFKIEYFIQEEEDHYIERS